MQSLPTIMLGLRTRIRRETDASPADLVFGKALRIPGDFSPFTGEEPDVWGFYNDYREYMRQLRPVPVDHRGAIKPFVHKRVHTCTHVWMRAKPIKPTLSPSYVGPFKVMSRNFQNRTFDIQIDGAKKTVPMERLKPAFLARDELEEANDKKRVESNLKHGGPTV